jgi:ribulose 1,5-bisphosphate carboxylase large subunit-like protein
MHKQKVTATYHLSFQIEPVQRAVDLLLAEMTCGIQYVSRRDGVAMDNICGKIPYVDDSIRGELLTLEQQDDETYLVRYALPASNLDVALGGITNLWPMVAGEVFNFHFIKRATLVDVDLPGSFDGYYLGPRFGIEGIRSLLGVTGRPLFGSIIKPNLGLDPERAARTVEILAGAGFDFIKDDEISVSPDLCPLEQRVKRVSETVDRVSQRMGKKILFAANVTSDFSVLGKAAETAVRAGAGGLMIDPFCAGVSSIDFLRRNFSLPIYSHRVGYGLFCLGRTLNVSYQLFTKLFRLLGTDFSHVGGIWGVSESSRKKTTGYLEILRKEGKKRAAWPVVTGISTENMSDYYDFYGDDTMFMDHIDIYGDVEKATEKLVSLKERAR